MYALKSNSKFMRSNSLPIIGRELTISNQLCNIMDKLANTSLIDNKNLIDKAFKLLSSPRIQERMNDFSPKDDVMFCEIWAKIKPHLGAEESIQLYNCNARVLERIIHQFPGGYSDCEVTKMLAAITSLIYEPLNEIFAAALVRYINVLYFTIYKGKSYNATTKSIMQRIFSEFQDINNILEDNFATGCQKIFFTQIEKNIIEYLKNLLEIINKQIDSIPENFIDVIAAFKLFLFSINSSQDTIAEFFRLVAVIIDSVSTIHPLHVDKFKAAAELMQKVMQEVNDGTNYTQSAMQKEMYNAIKNLLIRYSYIISVRGDSGAKDLICFYMDLLLDWLEIIPDHLRDEYMFKEAANILGSLNIRSNLFVRINEGKPIDENIWCVEQSPLIYSNGYEKLIDKVSSYYMLFALQDIMHKLEKQFLSLRTHVDHQVDLQDNLAKISKFDGGMAFGFYHGMCRIEYENKVIELGKFISGFRYRIHVLSYPNDTKFIFIAAMNLSQEITGIYIDKQGVRHVCSCYKLGHLINLAESNQLRGLISVKSGTGEWHDKIFEGTKVVNPTTVKEIIDSQYSDHLTYPKDQSVKDSVKRLIEKYELTVAPEYVYTLAIDRHKIEDNKKIYSPTLFDNSDDCMESSYIDQFFLAFEKMLSSDDLNFAILTQVVAISLAQNGSESILSIETRVNNSINAASKYYNTQDVTELYGFKYDKTTLLNPYCKDVYYYELGAVISSKYPSKQHIIDYYRKYLNQYRKNIEVAQNEPEKIAAIILFISQLECSHFFINGNNRLSCQILLNKLLLDNKLPICALYVPNGFSHYCLNLVNRKIVEIALGSIEGGTVDELTVAESLLSMIPTIKDLTNALYPAIEWVKEGQEFCQKTVAKE
ncbi:MAG: Ankyrin repeat-containing protein [Pseudomonadota bacterium]|nr:Ankyrin repeat-containing protein [Pseudomonadota bacterium]